MRRVSAAGGQDKLQAATDVASQSQDSAGFAAAHGNEPITLEAIGRRFADRNDIRLTVSADRLTIEPVGAAGFAIGVAVHGRRALADFGGCRQDIDDLSQVAACIDAILSGAYRLRVDVRNETPFAWTIEDLRHGTPRALFGCSHPTFRIWPIRGTVEARYYAYPRVHDV